MALPKSILMALEEMKAAKAQQKVEIPDQPTFGVKYPIVARNLVMIEFAKLHAGITPSTMLRHKGALRELRTAILETGISQSTLWQWTKKYTNIISQAQRYNVLDTNF